MYCVLEHSPFEQQGYRCEKYVGGSKVHDEFEECPTLEDLRKFLLSVPGAPVDEIEELINGL